MQGQQKWRPIYFIFSQEALYNIEASTWWLDLLRICCFTKRYCVHDPEKEPRDSHILAIFRVQDLAHCQ
jgi:hypothetical protein